MTPAERDQSDAELRPQGGPNLAEVLDRAAKRAASGPLAAMPRTAHLRPTSGVVVRRGPAGLEAAEFRRDSPNDEWELYQILIRPDARGLGPEAVDVTSVAARGMRTLQVAERQRENVRRMQHERRGRLDQLLSSWKDASAQRGMAEYAALAWAYADEARRGNAKATAAVAQMTGSSPAVAAQRIKEARRRGLLTPGQQGRASGEVTQLGVLYTRPGFDGLATERRAGSSVKHLAKKYRLSEAEVGAALAAEGYPELASDGASSRMDEHEDGGGV